jgi:GxxExxY protein
MDTNKHELIYKEEVYNIINASIEVINSIGHGFFEKVYENALKVEFSLRNIPYSQQQKFIVNYKGYDVGEYIPDLIVYNSIILEIKTIDGITNHERGQIINYLKITSKKAGVILNFKKPKLEWERFAV